MVDDNLAYWKYFFTCTHESMKCWITARQKRGYQYAKRQSFTLLVFMTDQWNLFLIKESKIKNEQTLCPHTGFCIFNSTDSSMLKSHSGCPYHKPQNMQGENVACNVYKDNPSDYGYQ